MSLRVMRMKAKNKTLMAEANSRQGNTFALGFTRTGIKQGACCEGGIHIKSIPSHQQSYSLYLKRATMGIGGSGGLASRVVDFPPNSGETKGTFQKMLTFKRPQKFTTSNYIENKKSKAIRCEVMDKCSPRIPITHNKTVTVATKFYVDGVQQPTLTFIRGDTYIFDQSDSTNGSGGSGGSHPLRFSITSDGTWNSGVEYTDGVTTSGTAGTDRLVTIVVPDTAPNTLYYYCGISCS